MHEMSITQSVIDICGQNAAGRRVTSVTLEIGELSGVVADAVEFCFEACSKGTLVDGALLHIEQVPGMGRCRDCGLTVAVHAYYDPCPTCGGFGIDVISGEELRVKELEVE
jgi:hydrogenase nickel incorporation protein HypA/HybF